MKLTTNWMGITFRNPVLMASATPFSHCSVDKHARYLIRAYDYGAGGIILPSASLVKKNLNDDLVSSRMIIEVKSFQAGLSKNDNMGFSVLGKTSNILSLDYIISLAKSIRANSTEHIPLLASVANNGNETDFIATVSKLIDSSLFDGLELNFSCPNIEIAAKKSDDWANLLNVDVLDKIMNISKSNPISVKLKPNINDDVLYYLLSIIPNQWGVTISNAYIGLEPPSTDDISCSPYNSFLKWSPSGVYGPFERLLTFYDLYRIIVHTQQYNLISSVGGYLSSEHVIQAILLGACTVQLSSAIAWCGTKIFGNICQELYEYLSALGVDSFDSVRGKAVKNVFPNIDSIDIKKTKQTMRISEEKCSPPCPECKCVDKLCFAITQEHRGALPFIDPQLCSGCGWCIQMCRKNAILKIKNNE